MKKDPIIRMLLIIILGSIAFQFLFNIITGGGEDMDDMSSQTMMTGSSTTLDGFLSGILVLLVKFLLIILVLSLIVCIIMWIKNSFFKNVNFNFSQYASQNPIIKTILSIAGVFVGLIFILYLFNLVSVQNSGFGYSLGAMSGNSSMMGGTFNSSLGLTGVITFLIEVLSVVFIVSLIVGLAAFLKKQFESANSNSLGGSNAAMNNNLKNTNNKSETSNPMNTDTNPLNTGNSNSETQI